MLFPMSKCPSSNAGRASESLHQLGGDDVRFGYWTAGSGDFPASAEPWLVPAAAVDNFGASLHSGPHIFEAKIEWGKTEPDDVGRAEIPYDAPFDQRLANLICIWMPERDVAAALAGFPRRDAEHFRAAFRHQPIAMGEQ